MFTIALSAVLHPVAQTVVSLVAKLQAASTWVSRNDRRVGGISQEIHRTSRIAKNDNLAEDKELCALTQSAEARIKTRSKEYAAMLRKITPEQENAYQSTKGSSAKAQFRQDWAKEQYALAKKSRVEKQSWKEADADIGECKVLAKIVEDEGFATSAIHHVHVRAAGREVGSLRRDAQRTQVLARAKTAQPHIRACVESVHDRRP